MAKYDRKPKDIDEVTEEVKEEVTEEVKDDTVIGIVSNCEKLRIREKPNGDVLTVVDAGSEIMIDEKESTEEFYKVTTETGIDGYAMRQFVTIK